MNSSTTSRLEVSDLTVRFGAGSSLNVANDRLDFHVDSGEIVGLVGESGSGKSTLGRVLAGLQRPTAGELRVDGRILTSPKHRFRREDHALVQMIFQDPYSSLNPSQAAWQAVAEVLRVWHGVPRSHAKSSAQELLSEVGISAIEADRFPDSLSGGQRQRVSVARALAMQPKFLIADEPTSAIDQSIQAQLLILLKRVQAERSIGMVFISHDLRLVRYLTERIYVMHEGTFVESGATQSIFSAPKHAYTMQLIDSIPGGIDRDSSRV